MDGASEDVVDATQEEPVSSDAGAPEEMVGTTEEAVGATQEVVAHSEEGFGATEEMAIATKEAGATEEITGGTEEAVGATEDETVTGNVESAAEGVKSEEVANSTEEMEKTDMEKIGTAEEVTDAVEEKVESKDELTRALEKAMLSEVQLENDVREPSKEDTSVKPSELALKFLQDIDPDVLELCLFEDKLVNISPEGNHVGEFKASVEKTEFQKEELLLVQASSNGKIDDIPMRTSITAYIRPKDLSVVKQEHLEFIKIPGQELEKRTEMQLFPETGQLIVKRQVTQGGKIRKSGFKIPKEKLVGFVTEGTNVILERLMIKTCEENEEFRFVSTDSNSARLVPTRYTCIPSRKQQIGSKEMEVYGIERKLHSVADVPQTWQSFFLDDGHLSMRIQIGSPVVITLEKVPRRIEPAVFEPKPVFEKQPLIWEEDMEMKSKFLDRKEELKAGHQTYLRHHPEASALLADFFQFLLLRQPDDVIAFAADYFASFSNIMPDSSPYSHSKTSFNAIKANDSKNAISPRDSVHSKTSVSPRDSAHSKTYASPRDSALSKTSVSPRGSAHLKTSVSPRDSAHSKTSVSPRDSALSKTSVSPRDSALSKTSASPRDSALSKTSVSPRDSAHSKTSASPRDSAHAKTSVSRRDSDHSKTSVSPTEAADSQTIIVPEESAESKTFLGPAEAAADSETPIVPEEPVNSKTSINPKEPGDSKTSISPRESATNAED